MSFPDLIYRIAHDYPGKVPALAARMGKNPTVLSHKLNPNKESHGINADEIEEIIDFSDRSADVAAYFAEKADLLLIPKIIVQGSDMELLDGFMEVIGELGEFSTEFQKAYADKRIDSNDFKRLQKEGTDVMTRLAGFLDRIGQVVDDRPQHLIGSDRSGGTR